jgi:small-conductance mechanosensitive channel
MDTRPPHPPRFTRQRIDSPHVLRFCADMGAKLLLARRRQRQPEKAEPRRPPRDALARLRQDLQDLEAARQLYAERMQRIIDRILRPETALTGEPESTVDLWRITLTIWQRRSEQLHAEVRDFRQPNVPDYMASALYPSASAATATATATALAACWDSLIAQALDGLETAAALCTGQEAVRPTYEAALAPATAAQVLRLRIEPPAETVDRLLQALQQQLLAREEAELDAAAGAFQAEWQAREMRLRSQAQREGRCLGDGIGWIVLLALIGLGS